MIIRTITMNVPDDKTAEAEKTWKHELGPLLVRQTGCLTHLLLHSREIPTKFVSLSHWANQQAIDHYVAGSAREEIRNCTRAILGATKVEVEVYEVIG